MTTKPRKDEIAKRYARELDDHVADNDSWGVGTIQRVILAALTSYEEAQSPGAPVRPPLTTQEREEIDRIAKVLRKARISRDDRFELADELVQIARPIIVSHPQEPKPSGEGWRIAERLRLVAGRQSLVGITRAMLLEAADEIDRQREQKDN